VRFARVRLQAPAASLPALDEFYAGRLGLERLERDDLLAVFAVGETRLELAAAAGAPFYPVALLVPGDRFDAALAWARERVRLLPEPEAGEDVFEFDNWDARACYFHDPAGSIVELIAHRGIGESDAAGSFTAAELLGLSELGLVGDPLELAGELRAALGLELWDGTLEGTGRLAFVGGKGRTLILAPPGRGWLPTGRPAEVHPIDAVVEGPPARQLLLCDGAYRIRGS
jgi:hypothetical protein